MQWHVSTILPIKSLKDNLGSSLGTARVVLQFVNKFPDKLSTYCSLVGFAEQFCHMRIRFPLKAAKLDALLHMSIKQHSSTQGHIWDHTSDQSFRQL